MGNASTKESRGVDAGHRGHHGQDGASASLHTDRSHRRNRVSRGELGGLLGLTGGSSSQGEQSRERRETKQEREARRLEKERVARIAERERSMKEEHVDGGFLVTMGTYTGPEDFNKPIVRQLQIERKIAPFWRGLNDLDDQWTEPQIIAAARGLPVPPADQTPPEELIPRPLPVKPQEETSQNIKNLTVPIGGRSQSAASEHSGSHVGSPLPSPVSISSSLPRTTSPFKPARGKAIAAVLGGNSRNGSTTEIMPREINLPHDPFVNGQPIEVFLYKNATECPICFLTYPPYLNQTRCCGQPICSECFVQIKRPDPHFPEGHNENDPNHNPEEAAGLLVSEPACCPYCTQPDFGVTYDPPPFRRGLTYAISPLAAGSTHTAMSSSSSVSSGNLSPGGGGRRRGQSLSANSPNVILTDRIRPEWATKLQAARSHQARRAAAATALHTAAFLIGNNDNNRFRSRFSRRNTGGSGSAAASPTTANNGDGENGNSGSATPSHGASALEGNRVVISSIGGGGGSRSGRVNAEELEEMMFLEAVRMSIASEEERKRKAEKEEEEKRRKAEKEEKKEAKKREKEEKKAAKTAAKQGGPYESSGGRSGHSSQSASALSLPGLGFGRKRGNSAASNLQGEASATSAAAPFASLDVNSKDKGKAVDRSETGASENVADSAEATTPAPRPTAGPSHLRQMSSASSISSSILEDSRSGSFTSPSQSQDPRGGENGGDEERDRDPSASTEPLLNFGSLAEVVGVSIDGENAGKGHSQLELEKDAKKENVDKKQVELSVDTRAEHEHTSGDKQTVEQVESPEVLLPPKVMVTPDTPSVEIDADSKRLGYETTTVERTDPISQ
ncbi:hypothetical protein QBC38DRAFT_42863 [Podospora fimiseda]|uniref:Protein SIP5 n=1 Tax=Podospora fimiseda TaxID=252190 RepID=A0AAN7BHY2_9PEZI|nr:hypothetical protein QBC38DRAFT_42863 [Podospora fimiseda]